MVVFFGHGNDARGYQFTMGLLSRSLSVLFFIVAFVATKERIQPDPQQKTSLAQDLGRPHSATAPGSRCSWPPCSTSPRSLMRGSVMLPYFKYLAGNEMLFSWFNGFGLASLLVGVACSTALVTMRSASATLLHLQHDCSPAIFTWPCSSCRSTPPIVIHRLVEVLRQFAFGLSGPLLWAMMGDVADYGEWKTGRRATGTVTAAVVFALWVGLALGGAIAGWLFSFYGYVSNATVQTARAQLGIQLTASVYAGLAFFAAALCLFFYPITRELNQKIADELAERRKTFAPQVSS